jgi:hypothetical protein
VVCQPESQVSSYSLEALIWISLKASPWCYVCPYCAIDLRCGAKVFDTIYPIHQKSARLGIMFLEVLYLSFLVFYMRRDSWRLIGTETDIVYLQDF